MAQTSKIISQDFKGLDKLIKAFGDGRVVKVGILGKNASRKGGGANNAEVGLVNEFGSFKKGIPARSFLRMPISREAAAITKKASEKIYAAVSGGEMVPLLTQIGLACEVAVQHGFASGGFGQWAPNKPATIRRKKSSSPLIDTRQLRASVTSVVGKAA